MKWKGYSKWQNCKEKPKSCVNVVLGETGNPQSWLEQAHGGTLNWILMSGEVSVVVWGWGDEDISSEMQERDFS